MLPKYLSALLTGLLLSASAQPHSAQPQQGSNQAPASCPPRYSAACLPSLKSLSIDSLRQRRYGTRLSLLEKTVAENHSEAPFDSYLASYDSDGLRIYTRIDLPQAPAPVGGYPVLIFAHGWVGIDNAPGYQFNLNADYFYSDLIARYAREGYAVLTPGYRGHGTVQGKGAEGIEYMAAWDNASYLSPSFYAIDLINLLTGLPQLPTLKWNNFKRHAPAVNLERIALVAHSQGGDVALTALAISGNNPAIPHPFSYASIWSGNIADKLTQAAFFGPMSTTVQAFTAGDGSWTGSATAANGRVNSDFVFGFPASAIATMNTAQWTWQKERWPVASVEQALYNKYREMYAVLIRNVADIQQADFSIRRNAKGKLQVQHAPSILSSLEQLSAFNQPYYLHIPLALHFSDRDFYSPPEWNKRLQQQLAKTAYAFEYPGTDHALKISAHSWFSPPGSSDGNHCALQRDLAFFAGKNPQAITCVETVK